MATPAQITKRKKALKAYFHKHGWPIPKGLNLSGTAGPIYREMLRRLERHEWPKVPPTGEANTRVLAVLFPPKPQSVGSRALKVAKGEVDVKESPAGSNSGPRVSQYLAVCGLNHQPWCACFVTWSLRQVGWKQKGWNQAYVPSWVGTAHLAEHGLHTIGSGSVEAGDIVCFDWEDNGVADHIGWVAGPVRGGSFPTIEGNTSAGNNSNGGQVQERVRSVSDVACFIRVT